MMFKTAAKTQKAFLIAGIQVAVPWSKTRCVQEDY